MEEDTTEGITRESVEYAMQFLGVHNPKPEIPLETTLTGHQLVAMARRFNWLETQLQVLQKRVDRINDTPR